MKLIDITIVEELVKAGLSGQALLDAIQRISDSLSQGHVPQMSHGTTWDKSRDIKEKERERKRLYRDKKRDMSHNCPTNVPRDNVGQKDSPEASPHTPLTKPLQSYPPKTPPMGGQKGSKRVPVSEVTIPTISDWAAQNLPPGLDLAWELGKFQDYWRSGRKAPPPDGVAAFRNWLRKHKEIQDDRNKNPTKGASDRYSPRDDRDPAARAHDIANQIIAKRNAEWAARGGLSEEDYQQRLALQEPVDPPP